MRGASGHTWRRQSGGGGAGLGKCPQFGSGTPYGFPMIQASRMSDQPVTLLKMKLFSAGASRSAPLTGYGNVSWIARQGENASPDKNYSP